MRGELGGAPKTTGVFSRSSERRGDEAYKNKHHTDHGKKLDDRKRASPTGAVRTGLRAELPHEH
jgi:hypothetical protein